MILAEVRGDLFLDTHTNAAFVHCVSRDFALGAGIAKEFERRFKLRDRLFEADTTGDKRAILIDNVINLITKEKYFHKPTYESIGFAIEEMRDIVIEKGYTAIVMPRIGCGLDKLEWHLVKSILHDVFKKDAIIIIVYHKGE